MTITIILGLWCIPAIITLALFSAWFYLSAISWFDSVVALILGVPALMLSAVAWTVYGVARLFGAIP